MSLTQDFERLLQDLQSDDWHAKIEAVGLLGRSGDARAVEPLHTLMITAGYDLGQEAWFALKKLGWVPTTDADRAWGAMFLSEWSELKSLGSNAAEPIRILLNRTQHSNYPDDRPALKILASFRDPSVFDSVLPLVTNESAKQRAAAATALGHMRDSRAIPALKSLVIGDDDLNVRQSAAAALIACDGAMSIRSEIFALIESGKTLLATAADERPDPGLALRLGSFLAAVGPWLPYSHIKTGDWYDSSDLPSRNEFFGERGFCLCKPADPVLKSRKAGSFGTFYDRMVLDTSRDGPRAVWLLQSGRLLWVKTTEFCSEAGDTWSRSSWNTEQLIIDVETLVTAAFDYREGLNRCLEILDTVLGYVSAKT